MPFNVKRVEAEPIIVVTLSGKLTGEDIQKVWEESERLLADHSGQAYRIYDTRDIDLDFGSLVTILADAGATRKAGAYKLQSIIELVVADTGSLVQFGAESLSQDQYGAMNIEIFPDTDAALAVARQRLKES